MGKRSTFERHPRDYYKTPAAAVAPLLPHLEYGTQFVEPCAGDGALVRHLEAAGMSCVWAYDIEPQEEWIGRRDALDGHSVGGPWHPECVITNPPFGWPVLSQMIDKFSRHQPAWLLLNADFAHNKQSAPYLHYCTQIVSIGRVKWFPGTKDGGMENHAWYCFDQHAAGSPTVFHGRAAK